MIFVVFVVVRIQFLLLQTCASSCDLARMCTSVHMYLCHSCPYITNTMIMSIAAVVTGVLHMHIFLLLKTGALSFGQALIFLFICLYHACPYINIIMMMMIIMSIVADVTRIINIRLFLLLQTCAVACSQVHCINHYASRHACNQVRPARRQSFMSKCSYCIQQCTR